MCIYIYIHYKIGIFPDKERFFCISRIFTVSPCSNGGVPDRAAKKALAAEVGISRFKQRLFVEDGSREIQDDEVLALPPLKIQLGLGILAT